MENKIIVVANIKGGVGKTRVTATLAHYLSENGIPCAVVDADTQQSLTRRRKRELSENSEAEPSWQLHRLDPTDAKTAEKIMPKLKQLAGAVLIDCPGSINDPALRYIFDAADVCVVPFEYDADVLDATILFGETFRKVSKARMFFVPNKVNSRAEKRDEIRKAREDAFNLIVKQNKLGFLTNYIKYTVNVQCYSTIESLNSEQRSAIKLAYTPILESIQK